MKIAKFALVPILMAGSAHADGLYYVGTEVLESLPLRWSVGASVIYDDNVSPGGALDGESSLAWNGSVGVSFVNVTPRTTWDVYARLGLISYFDNPAGTDDINYQVKTGINMTYRFSERLRFSSSNSLSFDLEPDYSYGYANTRSIDETLFWQTSNSVGFRWSERFATYTGLSLSVVDYQDVENNDRFTWSVNTQGRYQLSPNTVLTADYRHGITTGNGVSADSSNQYVLGGIEHRFSPNSVAILRAGSQFRDVDGGASTSSPYLELAVNSQMSAQLRFRMFARYGLESYDTVQTLFLPAATLVEFDERKTLRLGINAEYTISPMMSLFGGIDYIPTYFEGGRIVNTGLSAPDQTEDVINATLGLSVRLTNNISGSLSFTHTNSTSDLTGREYDRNRVSLGVSAAF